MSVWQSIKSAPLDGTLVDLWTTLEERVTDAKWDARRGAWVHWAIGGFDTMDWRRIDGRSTHWMPLPSPPSPA